MSFRAKEKARLIELKNVLFSPDAQPDGYYPKQKKRYKFCLHESSADQNLHESIRKEAIKYFKVRDIDWHDGINGHPSNHLCCSQSACVNTFYPYRYKPEFLKNILLEIGYPVKEVLQITLDKSVDEKSAPFVAFEWIGKINYLKELVFGKVAEDNERKRGSGVTSADFAILFKRTDDKIQLILGEWKYTEEYKGKGSIRISESGTDRLDKIYKQFLENNSPINISPFMDYSILFYDPFDQLMRLQLLAKQMELSNRGELNADIVTVLHIAPKANKELMEFIPNDELKNFGTNIHNVWMNIAEPGKFKGFYTEDLIDIIIKSANSPYRKWSEYMKTRYAIK